MDSILQVAGSLGVGAFLGLIIFLMYRQDRRDSEARHLKAWEASEARLSKLLEEDHETREGNTKVLTELTILIKKLNGKS